MGRYLDIGGTRYLLEQLHDIMERMLVGDIDLSNYVTKSELQTILDGLQIDVDLSAYATKEELENAIKGIDLSAYATKEYVTDAINNAELGGDGSSVDLSIYAKKTDLDAKADKGHKHTMSDIADYEEPDLSVYATREEIPSLDGYATEEYVDNAISNIDIPTGGNVDLSNYYNKEEVDEKDLMIAPFNCMGDRIVTDNMPDIKAYAGTNTITFGTGVDVIGGILVNGKIPYYFNDYAQINGNTATFEAESECNVKDYVFTIGDRPEGLTTLTLIVTNGSHSDTYRIPLHKNDIDGSEYVYYRKIWGAPLYIKRTKLNFAQSSFAPINKQVYENRDAIKELQNNGVGTLVTLYDEWNKDRCATSVPTVKLYAGTNTITLSDGVTLNAYINSTDSDYYILDDYEYKSKVNSFTIDSGTDKDLHDYIFRSITLGNGLVPQRDYSIDGTWYEGYIYNTSPPPAERAYSFYFVPLSRGVYNITYNADKTPYLHPKTVFFVVDTSKPDVNSVDWFNTTTTKPYDSTILYDYESTDTIANTATFTIKSADAGIIVAFYEYRNFNTEGGTFKLSYSDFYNIIDIVPTNDNVFEIEFTLTNGTHSDVYAIDITNFNNATQILRYSTAQLLERVTEEDFAMYTLTEFATKEDLESIVVGGDTSVLDNYYTKPEVDALIPTVSDGKDGEDGFSPIATVTKADGGATISITDTNGTTTVTVSDGVNGEDGKDGTNGTNGTDGITPHIDETTKHWFIGETDTGVLAEGVDGKDGTNGVNGTDGKDGTDGYTPVRGADYWTEQDIQTIKDYIDTELGVIENGSY